MGIKITIENVDSGTDVVLVKLVDAKNKPNNRHCDEELRAGEKASFWVSPEHKLIVSQATVEELAKGSGPADAD